MREARLAGSDWVKSILGGLDEHVVRGKREREREGPLEQRSAAQGTVIRKEGPSG